MIENIRYRLVPQMKDYDRLGQVWKPYLMYFHTPNYQTAAVSTDSFGLRHTEFGNRRVPALGDLQTAEPKSILIGGSTVFGIGATSNGETIASILSRYQDHMWVNLGGRAFSGSQELILFQSLLSRLGEIDQVVILSGLNDLFLPAFIADWEPVLGGFFFQTQFLQAMDDTVITAKRRLLRACLRQLVGDDIDCVRTTREGRMLELRNRLTRGGVKRKSGAEGATERLGRVDAAMSQMRKNLHVWSALSRGVGFRLTYALQPTPQWSRHSSSKEEVDLFQYLDLLARTRVWSALESISSHQLYSEYATRLRRLCEEEQISFLDLNDGLSGPEYDEQWLFVDRGHLTDAGHNVVARALLKSFY